MMVQYKKYEIRLKGISLLVFVLITCSSFAQNNQPWFLFWNSDSTMFGFVDEFDSIRVEPKFTDFITPYHPNHFDHFRTCFEEIIAVGEEIDGVQTSYYFTKSGLTFGRDSIHDEKTYFDKCESEGTILFKDKHTGRLGMFDKNGEVIIPAEYDDLSSAYNGVVWARKRARRTYFEESIDYEDFYLDGGQTQLLNLKNEVLIDNFINTQFLNPYSMSVDKELLEDSTRVSYMGLDSNYYSFVNYKLEIIAWLNKDVFFDLTPEKLSAICYDSVTFKRLFYNGELRRDKVLGQKSVLIDENFERIKTMLEITQDPGSEWFITSHEMNILTHSRHRFRNYIRTDGQPNPVKFPVMWLVIDKKEGDKYLDQYIFKFLYTGDSYKLIMIEG